MMASPAEVRAWAADNGYEVPERGRLGAEVKAAYAAAHPDDDDTPDLTAADDPGQADDRIEAGTEEEGPGTAEEIIPTRPRRPRRGSQTRTDGFMDKLLGGRKRGGKDGRQRAGGNRKPRQPRIPVDKFITRGYARIGQMIQAAAPCTGRCVKAQAAMAGVLWEDVVRDTAADRVLQPIARVEHKLDAGFAILAPPLIVFAIETGDPRNEIRRLMLFQLLREALLIGMDATEKYADQIKANLEKHAANEAEIDKLIAMIFDMPQGETIPEGEDDAAMADA